MQMEEHAVCPFLLSSGFTINAWCKIDFRWRRGVPLLSDRQELA